MDEIVRSAATTSWIDERLFGLTLPEVDWGSEARFTDNLSASRNLILGREAYRFSNFLEASIRVQNRRIVASNFTPASDLYRSPSFFDIESESFAVRRSKITTADSVTFKQLVGCRTQSPEVIAEVVGGTAGVGTGLYIGIRTGSPYIAVALGTLGGWFGHRVGREVVEEIMVFPPIWTEISLTIHVSGRTESTLTRRSLFPSVCLYSQSQGRVGHYQRDSIYDARTYIDRWKQRGWGCGNPWSIPNPQGWGDNRRHASLTSGSRTGSTNLNGPVRGSVAAGAGAVLGGSALPGPTTA